jgi:hypothetical protein
MSIEERFYSEAFEDGFNYAIQRMFGDDEEKKPKKWPYVVGGTAGALVGGTVGTGLGLAHETYKSLDKSGGIKTIKDNEARLKKGDNRTAKEVEEKLKKQLENYYKKNGDKVGTSALKKMALGGAIGTAVPVGAAMALYHHRKNKLNRED